MSLDRPCPGRTRHPSTYVQTRSRGGCRWQCSRSVPVVFPVSVCLPGTRRASAHAASQPIGALFPLFPLGFLHQPWQLPS